MAYAYCYYCNAKLDVPTTKEKLSRAYRCPKCNRNNWDYIDPDEFHEALMELLDRIETLESKVDQILPQFD